MTYGPLVIHPRDRSTDFLKPIYSGLDATVIDGAIRKDRLLRTADKFDQIIMLGHGTAHGLLSAGQFPPYGGHVVDDSWGNLLAERDNNVMIWCHAENYARFHGLRGFFTGMFISELGEAQMFLERGHYSDREVRESNALFAEVAGRYIGRGLPAMYDALTRKYGKLAEQNRVAEYNYRRLFLEKEATGWMAATA